MVSGLLNNIALSLILLVSWAPNLHAEEDARALCILEKLRGAAFLHKRNPNLYASDPVQVLVKTLEQRTGATLTQPSQQISAWLDYLQDYQRSKNDPEVAERIKNYYYKKYVTHLDEVPESFYELQQRMAREQGHGNLTLTAGQKSELAKIALDDQKNSFAEWLDYLSGSYSDSFPMWAKHWAFNGMTKLGKYDPETGTFSARSKGQMGTFPDLNREALALTIDAVVKKVNQSPEHAVSDPAFLGFLEGANFGKLYGRALQLVSESKIDISSVEGKWVTYKRGSDPGPLVASLRGMNTGWCTAGENTAPFAAQRR